MAIISTEGNLKLEKLILATFIITQFSQNIAIDTKTNEWKFDKEWDYLLGTTEKIGMAPV